MRHLKLYIQTLLILETLDEIEENGLFKKRLKLRTKQLKEEIENFDKSIFSFIKEDFESSKNELNTVGVLSEKFNKILTEVTE